MASNIIIKGLRDGLLIQMGEGSWEEIHQTLLDHLDQQAQFLRGARLALDVGGLSLRAAELGQLRKEITARELALWAVVSNSMVTQETAKTLGLETEITKPRSENERPLETTLHEGEDAILLRRTLRSGYSIQHAGHVVVIGDVNPGAEIVAGGDIVVWGKLRGTVHAGAEGNEGSVVCALSLSPTQLRISGKIALTPKQRGKPLPEMALIKDGQVVAEPWDPKRERS